MQQYQRSWLDGQPLDEYISGLRRGAFDLNDVKLSCQEDFAKQYHQAERPWWEGNCSILVGLALILRIIAIFLKRSFLENKLGGNYEAMACYFLAEFAGVAVVVVGVRVRQRSTFNRSFWLLVVTIVTLAGDIGSVAYWGGSDYKAKVDNPQYTYLIFRVLVEGLKLEESIRVLCRQIGAYTHRGQRAANFWSLLTQGFPSEAQFGELPVEEKFWACATLIEVLESGSKPGNWGQSISPSHPGIWTTARLFGPWFLRKIRWFLTGFWWVITKIGSICSCIRSFIYRKVRDRSSSPPGEMLPPPNLTSS